MSKEKKHRKPKKETPIEYLEGTSIPRKDYINFLLNVYLPSYVEAMEKFEQEKKSKIVWRI